MQASWNLAFPVRPGRGSAIGTSSTGSSVTGSSDGSSKPYGVPVSWGSPEMRGTPRVGVTPSAVSSAIRVPSASKNWSRWTRSSIGSVTPSLLTGLRSPAGPSYSNA